MSEDWKHSVASYNFTGTKSLEQKRPKKKKKEKVIAPVKIRRQRKI